MRKLVALVLVQALVLGCWPIGADWLLVVQNDTDQVWLLRVGNFLDDKSGGLTRISRVPPHAHGVSLEWHGSPDKRIDVLTEDCAVVAVLEPPGSGDVAADKVPALRGRIEPWRSFPESDRGDIWFTDDCGGFIYI